MSYNPSTKEMIIIIAQALGELNDKAVFVGGATVPFYLPDAYLSAARPTEDVDVVLEIVSSIKSKEVDEILRTKKFTHDTSQGAPICRWIYSDFKVDIMSSDSAALGFTNKWYKEGMASSIEIISSPVQVKIFRLPHFIASKMEAFKDRGNDDYIGSSDMEDIISILSVCPTEILEGMRDQCSANLLKYLRDKFKVLLSTSDFLDALPGGVLNRANVDASVRALRNRMEIF